MSERWLDPTEENARERENKPAWRKNLMKDLAVASSLVICAVTLRCGALPGAEQAADAVLTAMTEDTLLSDHLGRLSFVSKLFPEAALVFGESGDAGLVQPVAGEAVHAWSEVEPYMAWRAVEKLPVVAALSGEVMEVSRGAQGELMVKLRGADGRVCVYGQLAETALREGDAVDAGDRVGYVATGQDVFFELQEAGRSVDPTALLGAK